MLCCVIQLIAEPHFDIVQPTSFVDNGVDFSALPSGDDLISSLKKSLGKKAKARFLLDKFSYSYIKWNKVTVLYKTLTIRFILSLFKSKQFFLLNFPSLPSYMYVTSCFTQLLCYLCRRHSAVTKLNLPTLSNDDWDDNKSNIIS